MRIAVMMIAVIVLLIACGNQDDPTGEAAPAVRIGAVAVADEAVQSNRVEHSDETTPDDEIAHPSGVDHTGAATPAREAASPSSMGQAHGFPSPKGRIPAPLRLRIYEATAIVRATLITSSATTEHYSAADGTGIKETNKGSGERLPVDGEHRAVHSFRFRVTEYLKGSGASEITVTVRSVGTHGTEAEALQVAGDSLAERGTLRDTHEAILFLWEPMSNEEFRFLRSGPYPSLHYTIDTLNRVWLPAKYPPSVVLVRRFLSPVPHGRAGRTRRVLADHHVVGGSALGGDGGGWPHQGGRRHRRV